MLDLDPHLLRAFVAVAEVGTVNGAAALLNRTQAAVSMQVRKLESLVGEELFVRSAKGLELKSNGQLLVAQARRILALNDQIGRYFQGDDVEGRIRLGVVEDFAAVRLVEILSEFRKVRPKMDVDIIIESNRRLAAMLENSKLDIAVCDTAPLSRKPVVVWNEELFWVARSDFAVDGPRLPVIMFEDTCPWRKPAIRALETDGIAWKLACEASSLVAMATAVRVGIGMGPMFADTIPTGCEIFGGPGVPAPVRIEVGLYTHFSASPHAQHLIEFVAQHPELREPRPLGHIYARHERRAG